MTISTVATYTPSDRLPKAYAADSAAVALEVDNRTLYRLHILIGSRQYIDVPPLEHAIVTGLTALTSSAWVIITPQLSQNYAVLPANAGSAVITSYASGDALPPTGTYTPVAPASVAQGIHDGMNATRFGSRLSARDFGAVGDGVHDDTTALQALIDCLGVIGGGTGELSGQTYLITATLNIGNGAAGTPSTVNGVRLEGTGVSNTILKWGGAAAGTMVALKGICNGNALGGLTIDGASSAGYGLALTSAQYAQFGDLEIKNTTIAGLYTTCNASGAGTNNNLGLKFGALILRPAAGTVGQQSFGLWLDGAAANSADTNQCEFPLVQAFGQNQYQTGVRLGFCDFNNFSTIACFVAGTGSVGVELFGTTKANFPSNNRIRQLAPGGVAPTITGTVGVNWVDHFDTADGGLAIPSSGFVGYADNPNGGSTLVPFGSGAPLNNQGSVLNFQITATTATNVVSLGLANDGLYLALLYLRQTNATAVTVTATAFVGDESGAEFYYFQAYAKGAGAATSLNAASLAQNQYTCLAIPLRYASGQAQKPLIQVTASVANVVFCSASIVKVA